jgi:hypothetical protein
MKPPLRNGHFNRPAELVCTFHTRAAMHAAAFVPTTDPLAEFQTACVVAWKPFHRTDRFMTGDKGVACHAPFIVDHRLVGMADPQYSPPLQRLRHPAGLGHSCTVQAARQVLAAQPVNVSGWMWMSSC